MGMGEKGWFVVDQFLSSMAAPLPLPMASVRVNHVCPPQVACAHKFIIAVCSADKANGSHGGNCAKGHGPKEHRRERGGVGVINFWRPWSWFATGIMRPL